MTRHSHPWGVFALVTAWGLSFLAGVYFVDTAQLWPQGLAFDPSQVARWMDVGQWPAALSTLTTLITAQFVHLSGWHLLGNLAYFLVFGLPVERVIGGVKLLCLTLLLGSFAYLVPALVMPMDAHLVVGASGAVSGVLGLYLALMPKGRIRIWVPLGIIVQPVELKAGWLILSWLVVQLIFLSDATTYEHVAIEAHLSGLVAGILVGLVLRGRIQPRLWRRLES